MRICYVCSFKEDSGGGISQVVFNLAKYFSKAHKVLIVIPGERTRYFFDEGRGVHFLEVGSVGKGLLYIPRFGLRDVIKLYKYLKLFSPQIIHLHDEGPIPLLFLSFSLLIRVPIVFTSHLLPFSFHSFGLSDLLPKTNKVFTKKIVLKNIHRFYSNSDAIVGLNKSILSEISMIIDKKNLYEIPNAIEVGNVMLGGSFCRRKFDLVYVGTMLERKNQDYLIEVMRFLPQKYILTLIGDTPNKNYFKKLNEKIKKYKLKNIKFLGKIPHAQIPGTLATSQLFVSASLLEVQSLAVLEALASGTPIVSLSNATTVEFVDKSVGANFPQTTPPSVFAQKIEELCELDEEKYDLLCKNSKSKVTHLALETIGPKTLAIYAKLITGKASNKKGSGIKYTFLAAVFAKCVRFLYFLDRVSQSYEKTIIRNS